MKLLIFSDSHGNVANMEDAVRLAGGAKIKDPVYFVGGVMMGKILPPTAPITAPAAAPAIKRAGR